MDNKRESDTDHPSKKKCNQLDFQKSKCCYVHKTLMPTSNVLINQQDIPRFTCKTCQKNLAGKNKLMHHRKREHPINIVCKYFLTNTCRRSSNQGALSWFRHYQLHLSAPNVGNATPYGTKYVGRMVTKSLSYFLHLSDCPTALWGINGSSGSSIFL